MIFIIQSRHAKHKKRAISVFLLIKNDFIPQMYELGHCQKLSIQSNGKVMITLKYHFLQIDLRDQKIANVYFMNCEIVFSRFPNDKCVYVCMLRNN